MPALDQIGPVPTDPADLPLYLQQVMPLITSALVAADDLERTHNVVPPKLSEGLLRYADGTNWNPGSGAGWYRYTSGAWVLMLPSGGGGVYLPLAGGTMSGNIAMGSGKLTGLAAGSVAGDSVRFEQLGGASVTELGYVVGVTSGIQAQIDAITGIVPILSQTASSDAVIDFTLSGYERYALRIDELVPATNDAEVYMRISDDGGATFKAGATDYNFSIHGNWNGAPGTFRSDGATGATFIQVGGFTTGTLGIGTAAGDSYSATIEIMAALSSSLFTRVSTVNAAWTNSGGVGNAQGTGLYKTAVATDAIRVLMSSGNIASGNFTLFGIA